MMMQNAFRLLNCRLDPWQAEYGLGFSATEEQTGQTCSTDQCSVEVPVDDWTPLNPRSQVAGPILFVDGVRRIHLRIIQQRESQFFFGAIGSIAVGASVVEPGHINTFHKSLIGCTIKHLLLLADCSTVEEVVRIPLNYPANNYLELECHEISGHDPQDPINQLQQKMREEEALLIQNQPGTSSLLLVADGPLNMQLLGAVPAVGYVKTLHSLYIPENLFPVLWKLKDGQRSPIFLIQPEDRLEGMVSRYSCYARIAPQMEKYSVMSGLVRLEMSAGIPIEQAKDAFDRCTAEIPFFAAPWGTDPRAPQNLVPLSALEMELRRRIGHSGLIQRILQDQF
jgi:hypothetical protein